MSTWADAEYRPTSAPASSDATTANANSDIDGCSFYATEVDHIINVAALGISRDQANDEQLLQAVCVCMPPSQDRARTPRRVAGIPTAQARDANAPCNRTPATDPRPDAPAVTDRVAIGHRGEIRLESPARSRVALVPGGGGLRPPPPSAPTGIASRVPYGFQNCRPHALAHWPGGEVCAGEE